MSKHNQQRAPGFALAGLLVLALGLSPAWAEKPEGVGQGKAKGEKNEKAPKNARKAAEPAAELRVGAYFGDGQRQAARDYYGAQARGGKCPPGLTKKNNGCLPPGQAKKWGIGKPLPSDVVFYPVPPAVVVKLGPPPAGHKYVRVAADILLIAIGTSMVIDAIEDLARL